MTLMPQPASLAAMAGSKISAQVSVGMSAPSRALTLSML
jgi:hypothetical protein